MFLMKDIVIIGAGGFGREIKTLIDDINAEKNTYNFLGFFDNGIEKGKLINGSPVLGNIYDLNHVKSALAVAIAIGSPATKELVFNKLTNTSLEFPVLIHPSVIIGCDDIIIEEGTIICAGCILTCNIDISKFVTLNLMCTVGHDTIINDYCSFMPSVNISGDVKIHKGVYVGTGAKIINQLEIHENTIVGAGAVVSKSLPANCTAVGIPAKPIKYHLDTKTE